LNASSRSGNRKPQFKLEKFNPLPNKKLEKKFMFFYGPYNPRPNFKMSLDYSDDEKPVYIREPLSD
jgi:hypothetical protein